MLPTIKQHEHDSFKIHSRPIILEEEDEDNVRIGGPGPNDSIETIEMLRQKSARDRLEMLESLDITEEVEKLLPKTEGKSSSSLIRRFDMCFNDMEKSELISHLTSQSMTALMLSKKKSLTTKSETFSDRP